MITYRQFSVVTRVFYQRAICWYTSVVAGWWGGGVVPVRTLGRKCRTRLTERSRLSFVGQPVVAINDDIFKHYDTEVYTDDARVKVYTNVLFVWYQGTGISRPYIYTFLASAYKKQVYFNSHILVQRHKNDSNLKQFNNNVINQNLHTILHFIVRSHPTLRA